MKTYDSRTAQSCKSMTSRLSCRSPYDDSTRSRKPYPSRRRGTQACAKVRILSAPLCRGPHRQSADWRITCRFPKERGRPSHQSQIAAVGRTACRFGRSFAATPLLVHVRLPIHEGHASLSIFLSAISRSSRRLCLRGMIQAALC
jgi:hypothetical protein